MKDGDIVVCINDDYKGYKFILNKSYTVRLWVDKYSNMYSKPFISDENNYGCFGCFGFINSLNFKSISEYRNDLIDNLLV